MKLKKVLATGLSLLMAMGTIAGCGVSTDTGVNTNASSESGVAAAEKTDQKEEQEISSFVNVINVGFVIFII